MRQTTTMTQDAVGTRIEAQISRRMLLAGSAGLAGAAAMAGRSALAQGTPPAAVLPIQAPVRQDWLDKNREEIIEPALPIIDPHRHLWDRPGYRYLFTELLADVGSGHNIRATCYEQAREMYRADGPEELEVPRRDRVRFRGLGDERVGQIRTDAVHHRHHRLCRFAARLARQGYPRAAHRSLRRPLARHPQRLDLERRPDAQDLHRGRAPGLLLDKSFREGFATLAPLGLTFDAWMFQTQLGDVVDLARAFPQTTIVLNHCGAPLAIGPYAGKREEAFDRVARPDPRGRQPSPIPMSNSAGSG